jgi:Holliday junction resolvasome RuvABC DNA-binding subunit
MAALTNLGYSSDQARAALGALPTDRLLDTEERIRLALRSLSAG